MFIEDLNCFLHYGLTYVRLWGTDISCIKNFCFPFLFFPFYSCTWGIWKFLGQGLKMSCSCGSRHSCRNTRSELYIGLCHSPRQPWIFNPLSWAGDQTQILTEMLGFQPTEPQWELFKLCFTFIACSDTILLSLYIHLLCTFIFDFSFSIPFLFQLMIFIFTLISVFYKKKLQHWVFENP